MSERGFESFEERVFKLAEYFAGQLSSLSDDHVFRTAIVVAAIRDFSWELLDKFPDQQMEISDQLANLADGIREAEIDAEN